MKKFNVIFHVCILILSAAFLFFGNRIASQNRFEPEFEPWPVYPAVVTEIISHTDEMLDWGWGYYLRSITILFYARITGGDLEGQIVPAEFSDGGFQQITQKEVEVGDRVMIMYHEHIDTFFFMDYQRFSYVAILGVVFFVLIVIFGKMKGLNSLIALGFICMAVFLVLIPAILSGMNIYATAAIICVYGIVSTLLIIIGPNRKALSAMLGCLGGVIFAGLLMFFMDAIMHLTGLVDGEARNLLYIPLQNPIDIRAIVFAGVVIGSAGAIMDVAMSIASSLWEVRQAGAAGGFRKIFKAGTEIGKDILGTMLNTLILAYIGSSLSIILLLSAQATSLVELLNREMIIVELLRAIVGGFGMFLTIPLTAAICAWLYQRSEVRSKSFSPQTREGSS